MVPSFLFIVTLPLAMDAAAIDRLAVAPRLAARIDALVAQHWQANQIQPAGRADDSGFLRRVTLDLAGHIPTMREAQTFLEDRSADKRERAVRRLMTSPEYALNLGRVLEEIIQEKFAGDAEFLEYLRMSAAQHKPWDKLFREMMLGPWDTKEAKRADRFLVKRVRSLDELTNDTARVFFGVNVSCAKCHDHPLVRDWTQDHYYGMASFFNRTQATGKRKGATDLMEQPTGEVSFVTTKGERRTAKMMFLSRRVPDDRESKLGAAGSVSRREHLVRVALDEKHFFSRSIVNRVWAYLFGRGLVHPVDQMHSANPPSIPAVLEFLAEDLAAHGYDLDRLIAGLVSSRVYQLAGVRDGAGEEIAEKHFARALLRPLSPHQYSMSMVLAAGDGKFDQTTESRQRAKRYRELEGQCGTLLKSQMLDAPSERFQSSTGEALFISNHPEVQRLLAPAGDNLVARLLKPADRGQSIDLAFWTVLSRPPESDERTYLARWVAEQKGQPAQAYGELVWALLASAEFRFNH